jgi:hypothetical protein
MAEIELALLTQQCQARRLADQASLEREVAAWQAARNGAGRGVNWRFTTEDAVSSSSTSTSTLQFRADELLAPQQGTYALWRDLLGHRVREAVHWLAQLVWARPRMLPSLSLNQAARPPWVVAMPSTVCSCAA